VRLPAADELFRPTVVPDAVDPGDLSGSDAAGDQEAAAGPLAGGESRAGAEVIQDFAGVEAGTSSAPPRTRTPSGRVRHDEKMTVYVTADELLDVEHARLTLRRHGLAVDRGRLIREALAMALLDLEENGGDSALVQRLWRS
jgi:hypothetical protein